MKEQNVQAKKVAGLFNKYLKAVDWVREKKTASREEKLEQLIPPLCELKKIPPLPFGKEIPHRRFDGTFPFTSPNRIEPTDLDLDNLNYDRKRYTIDWLGDNISRARGKGPGIWLRGIKYEDRLIHCKYPADLYEKWLPSLDQATIQSRDLLDQILVCYTIKRALNGDSKAIEKLYGLYVDAAKGIAVNFAKDFHLRGKGNIKEIKGYANELLWAIISGFSPEDIMRRLTSDGRKGFVNSLPAWVKDFFIYYFSEYIPPRIQRNLEETRRIDNLLLSGMEGNNEIQENYLKDRYVHLIFEWNSLLNPYAPIKDTLLWKNSPVRKRRFNSFCFQPGLVKMGPHKNLTTWLFGGKGKIYGKLYQLLRDKYILPMKERALDFNEDFDEEAKTYEGSKKEEKALLNKIDPIKVKLSKKIRSELYKLGFSLRNADIYFKWKIDGLTQSQIAEENNLSLRQTKRICRNVKTIIPTIKNIFLEE